MRAKMKVTKIEKYEYGNEVLSFTAVTDGSPEDNSYSKFTPAGELKLTVNNPDLLGKFTPGEKYYLDFTKADQ